ncbi:hypothetical protein GBF38_004982 [Nibea albiflora]|uniref:Uncharacterized protein n=1 Tax=Nibea albiflora TaxID=240163 RepID=A0ACB7EV51_NIBAL|nr:hypothetical protein GBF38_004982 [Nibea albiflora]
MDLSEPDRAGQIRSDREFDDEEQTEKRRARRTEVSHFLPLLAAAAVAILVEGTVTYKQSASRCQHHRSVFLLSVC